MAREPDEIWVETAAGGCSLYSGVEIVTDLHGPATLTLQVGDEGSWRDLSRIFYPGEKCRLFCNGRVLFTGRWETNRVTTNPVNGSVGTMVARTKMSDARYTSADISTKVTGVSIKQFLVTLFAPLGYVESDFIFDAAADRDLVTGVRGTERAPVDLEPLQEQKAKIQPGEEIFAAASRHLKRHHLTLWDSADGGIVIGAPNANQRPLYHLRCKRDGRGNNITSAVRIRDWSEVAQRVEVYGTTSDDSDEAIPIRGAATDSDVDAVFRKSGHFARKLVIPLDGTKTLAKAEAQAKRELASRAKEKDAWSIELDAWSYWDGHKLIPYVLNTTADVEVDTIGSEGTGRYLIHRIVRNIDTNSGATCTLELVAPDVLVF